MTAASTRFTTIVLRALLGMCILAPASSALSKDAPAAISQKARRFTPAIASTRLSAPLTILNDDTFTHHIYYDDHGSRFDSGAQKPGQTVMLSFPEAGEYQVRCAIHPKMRLDVSVTP